MIATCVKDLKVGMVIRTIPEILGDKSPRSRCGGKVPPYLYVYFIRSSQDEFNVYGGKSCRLDGDYEANGLYKEYMRRCSWHCRDSSLSFPVEIIENHGRVLSFEELTELGLEADYDPPRSFRKRRILADLS